MCTLANGGPCPCTTRDRSTGIAVALAIGSAVVAFLWWLTGPQVIGRGRRERRYARRVHAAGRVGLVAVAVCAARWPYITAAVLAVAIPAAGTAAIVGRRRHRARRRAELAATPRPPLRVAVATDWPSRRRGEQVGPSRGHTWTDARTHVGDPIPQRRNPR